MRPHLATLVDDFQRHGDETAVVVYSGNRRHASSFAQLAHYARGFAAELISREIAMGDRVIVWGQNSAEWISVFFGCVLRGVLVVPLDASGSIDFAQRVIRETQPKLIVGDRELLLRLNTDVPVLALEEACDKIAPAETANTLVEAKLSADTPLQILFTSGTTSEPKGVVHTHRNVLASLEPIEREMQKYLRYERIFHPLRFLHTLPLSHVFGQFMGLWIPPLLAAEVHFESRLQAPRLLELIHRERISVLASVPRVLDLLKANLEERFPNLVARAEQSRGKRIWTRWWMFRDVHRALGMKFWAFVCGGASLPPSVERFWNDLGFALIQGYGMTETAALITLNHPFHIGQGTVGKPLPGREVRISEDGEVLVRGEMVSTARWQGGHLQTSADPWLRTGDLAERDADGQLRFVGRKSETIVTAAGLNIHPEDVEAALNAQPAIRASAVVAVETPNGPEAVAVVLSQATLDHVQEAMDAANEKLAEFQRVRRWQLWPQLDFPRTSTGKIRRGVVANWVALQKAAPSSTNGTPDALSQLIASVTRSEPRLLSDELRFDRDLNLDSLARVQLQTELEQRLGISVNDAEFERITTVGQLRAQLGMSADGGSTTQGATTASTSQASTPRAPSREVDHVYPKWTWSMPIRILRWAFQELVMRPLVWLLAAPRVKIIGTLPDSGEPVLIIANHVTAFDAPLVLYAFPYSIRSKVAMAMAGDMLQDWRHARNQGSWLLNLLAPIEYWLVTPLFNVFPLPRTAGFRRSFAHVGEALDHGYNVLVFPEGRRSADGSLQPFRGGIGLLAQESKAQVVPVALRGLGELKQRKQRWFRSRILEVRVGEPIKINANQEPEAIAESLHRTIASMLKSAD